MTQILISYKLNISLNIKEDANCRWLFFDLLFGAILKLLQKPLYTILFNASGFGTS